MKFKKGILKVKYDGVEYLAEYIGRQQGFECAVCGQGENCFTFNIFNNEADYKDGIYETLGFGSKHINKLELI